MVFNPLPCILCPVLNRVLRNDDNVHMVSVPLDQIVYMRLTQFRRVLHVLNQMFAPRSIIVKQPVEN
jgi:hypothetical protein